jgi:hypothetical protein
MKTLFLLGALGALGGCTAQEGANFISGAKTFCQDTELGITVVGQADTALATTTGVQKIEAICSAVSALPSTALNPIPAPTNSPATPAR